MAWEELKPRQTARQKTASAPATISCREPNADGTQSVVIVLRDGPDWFRKGESVGVRIGTKDDAGKLAIEPDGPFYVVSAPPNPRADKNSGPGSQVVIPLFEGAATIERREREPVEMKVEEQRIVLTLPAWARPKGSDPVGGRKENGPVVVPASSAPVGKGTVPYRGLGSSGPDPIVNEVMARRRAGIA